ncbi:hypothetical protein H5410_052982 [Solanum commersonii]|uniref:Uncharacterized protein n=1 Tax=Solanum commersonii TaxID=4109 RepID=A0A9J5X2K7_SOLCO|nr:hypothetical protein H5410_052982 [Solanum commersonii]
MSHVKEKGAKRVYLHLQYFGMYHGYIYSLKKEKRVLHLGEQIGVGKSEREESITSNQYQ